MAAGELLGSAILELKTDASGLTRGVQQAQRSAQDLDRSFRRVSDGLSQRFRAMGQALAPLTAGLGAFGVGLGALQLVQFARGVIETAVALERLDARFIAVTGSSQGAAREMAFVRDTADRLGLNVQVLGQSFSGIAAAAQQTTLGLQGARDIFTAVAEASAALQLSAQDTQGILLALQQIMSKGTVAAEELRGQIGERLPGAFAIAAKAMGVTEGELNTLLERGLIRATDFLPRFARALRESSLVQQGLAASAQSASAASNRLSNAWDSLMAAMARSGPLQAAARGMNALAGGINTLNLPVSSFAEVSADALNKVLGTLDQQIKLLEEDLGDLKTRLDLADTVPGVVSNLKALTSTYKFQADQLKALRTQREALAQTMAQALTPPTFKPPAAGAPPPTPGLLEQTGGLSREAISTLQTYVQKAAGLARLGQALGANFDQATARAKLLRETIETLITEQKVSPQSPVVQSLAQDLARTEAAIEAAQEGLQAGRGEARAAAKDWRQDLAENMRAFEAWSEAAKQHAADITAVMTQVQTPFEKFRAEVERLQAIPGLPAETLGRAVGEAANAFYRGTPEFQAWNDEQERFRAILDSLRGPTEGFVQLQRDLDVLQRQGLITTSQYNRLLEERVRTLPGYIGAVKVEADDASSAMAQLGATFTSAFEDAIVGGKGLSAILQGLGDDLVRISLRALVLDQLIASLKKSMEGKSLANLLSAGVSWIGGLFGGAGAAAPVTTAQHGTVVRGPTLIGEAGSPEAILPLTRLSSGDLGVYAAGGSGAAPVTVNVYNNTGASVQTRERQQAGGGKAIDVIIDEVVAKKLSTPGTSSSRALRGTYGASSTLVGR